MDIKNKRILITGGTGFIGKYLVKELLNQNNQLYLITRKKLQSKNNNLYYIQADLTSLDENSAKKIKLELKTIDLVYYLAANIPLLTDVKETIFDSKRSTLDPFLNYLEFFGDIGKKIIFTSTIDVYGYPSKNEYDENQAINPPTPYALAKSVCEKYLEYYCKINNKDFSIVRFSQVYGPNEPLTRVIPCIIDSVVKDKPFILYGPGLDNRKFLYIKDAVQGIIKAAKNGKNDVYHIAGDNIDNILDVVKTVEKVFDKKILINRLYTDRPVNHTLPNINKAKKILKFRPEYNLEKGILEIYKKTLNEKI